MSITASVIICTHGRASDLAGTLQSLRQVRVPTGETAELLVVENGAKDQTEAVVGRFVHENMLVRYVHEPSVGKSFALNRSLREARGEILVFTDDDVRFPSTWLAGLCEPLRQTGASVVAGGIRLAPHLLRPWMTRQHRAWLASTADYLDPAAPSEACGANMAIHRRVLKAVSAYDVELGPGLGNGEETLFTWQLREAGFPTVGRLEVMVEHHLNASRLCYGHWLKTIPTLGRARAYLLYHWLHESLSRPLLSYYYLQTKLLLRRSLNRRWALEEEGIAPWEMSYLFDMSKCFHYMRERRRPRNYDKRGRTKLHGEIGR